MYTYTAILSVLRITIRDVPVKNDMTKHIPFNLIQ